MTVAELAIYLEAFAQDLALPGIIKDLRSDKFASTFFELAMAYRWKKADAVVTLQPSTARGVADFQAVIGGRRHVVECSICPNDFFSSSALQLPMLLRDVLATADAPFSIGAKLTVLDYPKEEWQNRLRKLAKKGAHQLVRQHHAGKSSRIVEDHGAWQLELWIVLDTNEAMSAVSDWTHAYRVVRRPRALGRPAYELADEKRGEERARLFVKLPPAVGDPKGAIIDKFKREARQLRGIADARIVMLDISSIAPDVLEIAKDQVVSSIGRVTDDIPEMACAWLMSRGWSTALRFQYRASYVGNSSPAFQLPEAFLDKLGALEWRHDFITDQPIDSKGSKEDRDDYDRRSRPGR